MVDGEPTESGLFPMRVGERLRVAREAAGLDLGDIGTRTRIPMRHLEAIERGNYEALPSPTYAVGFVKSYARALDLDEVALARDLRTEIGRVDPSELAHAAYEPADPTRVPSRLLAWTAAVVAILVVAGYVIWRSEFFGDPTPIVAEQTEPVPAPQSAPTATPAAVPQTAPAPTGQVVLTATAPVWLRITDSAKKKLVEKELAAGESYSVPMDAADPRILTGRADAIKVTVDGREVPPLGPAERTISDVGVSAAALAARAPVATPPVAPNAPTVAQ